MFIANGLHCREIMRSKLDFYKIHVIDWSYKKETKATLERFGEEAIYQ